MMKKLLLPLLLGTITTAQASTSPFVQQLEDEADKQAQLQFDKIFKFPNQEDRALLLVILTASAEDEQIEAIKAFDQCPDDATFSKNVKQKRKLYTVLHKQLTETLKLPLPQENQKKIRAQMLAQNITQHIENLNPAYQSERSQLLAQWQKILNERLENLRLELDNERAVLKDLNQKPAEDLNETIFKKQLKQTRKVRNLFIEMALVVQKSVLLWELQPNLAQDIEQDIENARKAFYENIALLTNKRQSKLDNEQGQPLPPIIELPFPEQERVRVHEENNEPKNTVMALPNAD